MKTKKPTQAPLTFHIISLFPESFSSYLGESILARAQKEKKIAVKFYNPRDFSKPTGAQKLKERPYLRVDDKPYGGGPGMVMQALPLAKAIDKALSGAQKKKTFTKAQIVFLSPTGTQFTNDLATEAAHTYSDIIFLCGRYEGIDARVKSMFKMDEVSVGPFVTTGGELPAMIMIDAISRQIPGVLGNFSSREESRISSSDVYTRPAVVEFKKKTYAVPEVLLSGHHAVIDSWKEEKKSVKGTKRQTIK
ncbi:MAG: tRNA ((1)-)-methyltransferase, tRNA (guanine37-N1)-methyltransferase [Candidatus Parcubacteria bacterium]|jgi:tRNA (guanine37-N1)-methyltransferase